MYLSPGKKKDTKKKEPTPAEELAEIASYDSSTNSYVVITRGVGGDSDHPGGRQLVNIPRRVDNPHATVPLEEGALVVINWGLGFPYIAGVLPIEYGNDIRQHSLSTSPNITPPKPKPIGDFRTPQMPKDVVPGDWIQASPDGNRIGALRGGYNIMDGGSATKAKIETLGTKDLIRMTCDNLEVITGFGVLEAYNAEGHCGIKLRGGMDQLNESGGDAEQWTFKLDIGESGNYFNLEVCTPAGQTKAKLNITTDGQVTVLATNGLNLVNGGNAPISVEGASDLILKLLGGITSIVQGAVTENFSNSRDTTVSNKNSLIVGADNVQQTVGNSFETVGENYQSVITGGPTTDAKPKNIAVQTDILNGSVFIDVGNIKKGANPAAQAGYTVAVHNGKITLGKDPSLTAAPTLQASVALNTSDNRSVALGGTTETAMYNAVLYQPLMQVLQMIVSMFDAHVQAPYSPPTTPMSASVLPLINQIMSQRVLIGG
jgi:hypothetical protein